MNPALKEWSAVVHALLDGRQTVLLRKGGIGEKRFEVAAERFLLFPTVAHSHRQRVRPEHQGLLQPAAEDSGAEHVVVRAGANVVAAIAVSHENGLADIAPLHIWTETSVREDRLDFRPRHRLTVLVVAACPLVQPVRLSRTPLEISRRPPTLGEHTDEILTGLGYSKAEIADLRKQRVV